MSSEGRNRDDQGLSFFRKKGRSRPRAAGLLLSLAIVVWSSGCSTLPISSQRLVAKPNMQFADSAVFQYSSKLWPQTEPGSAFSGGAAAGGCTSCR